MLIAATATSALPLASASISSGTVLTQVSWYLSPASCATRCQSSSEKPAARPSFSNEKGSIGLV